MEQEELHLTLAYDVYNPGERVNDNGKLIYEARPIIRRAYVHRPRQGTTDLHFHRVQVDFDPFSVSLGYCVHVAGTAENNGRLYDDRFYFVTIYDNEDEANKRKEKLLGGEYKNYLEKGETFKEVVVTPILIAVN